MVAKITTGSNIYGALAYNQEKVDLEKGAVLATHILREPVDGRFSVVQTADDLMRWMPAQIRTEKPVIHISFNPDPKDNLSDGQFVEIADKYMERMGWGEQPYIVFKHTDIGREHIHIVSVQVGRDGNLPTKFWYQKKEWRGWINIVNPFRASTVLGTPGSGKSYAVVKEDFTPRKREQLFREILRPSDRTNRAAQTARTRAGTLR